MTGAKSNILEAVGNTPIIKLQKLARHVPAEIYVKCEYLNPGGSMKDRVAMNIIRDAERRGLLGPGSTAVGQMTTRAPNARSPATFSCDILSGITNTQA